MALTATTLLTNRLQHLAPSKMFMLNHLFIASPFRETVNRYLIPCPFKYLTGYDCPGCGFQRSLLALLGGNFSESFALYPATIPLLLTVIVSLAVSKWYPSRSRTVIKTLFILTASIIMVSYGIKIFMPHTHLHRI